MYNALTIANFIVEYEEEHHRSTNNLRLQKLLYFIQAKFLFETDQPCFKDKIYAWDFGSVILKVFKRYSFYGNCSISSNSSFDKYCGYEDTQEYIENNDQEMIIEVLEQASQYNDSELVQIVHNQEPWIKAYTWHNGIITNEAIRNFWKRN